MKLFACIFTLVAILGTVSAGYIRSGWSGYSRPVVRRVIYSPSYYSGYGSGYGGYGRYGGYGGYGGYRGYGGHGGWRSGWW